MPIYNEISQILLDESPWVWLYQGYRFQVRVPELEGFVPHPTGSLKSLRDVTLDVRLGVASLNSGVEHVASHRAAVDAGVVPGAVALVRHRGEVVLHEAFGSASLVPEARPMTPDTVFDLASLTKPLVGAGVALALVDRGAFSLDEEVTTFLPELESFRAKGVTMRRCSPTPPA